MARSRKRGTIIGLTVLALVVILVAGGMAFLMRKDTGCDQLVSAPDRSDVNETLVIELTGNSEKARSEARSFVSDQLKEASSKPEQAVAVDVVLVTSGELQKPQTSCLRSTTYLVPAPDDVKGYLDKGNSQAARDQFEGDLESSREEQIRWLADAVDGEIAATSFSASDIKWSPVSVWDKIAANSGSDKSARRLAILSPLISTANDCLSKAGTTKEQVSAAVANCIQFEQLSVLDGKGTTIVIADSAHSSGQTRETAELIRAELCKQATAGGCVS